ncbi:MAG: hypothetical protein H6R00_1896 [Proteobacteria bacterium]|nr:hypothetical protein [Pseudomonadota bacterium]
MSLNDPTAVIDADYEILEAIGAQVDSLIDDPARLGAMRKTVRQWFSGHVELPRDEDVLTCLMAMAADLDLFTPAMSGRTAMDRHLSGARAETDVEAEALTALGKAEFRLVRIIARESLDEVRLEDLVTGEKLVVLQARIAPEAAGLTTAMRLCPLASGRHVLISPLFALDEAMLAAAMKFTRPGRSLGTGHRCAANLYRDVARGGFLPIPQFAIDYDAAMLAGALDEAQLSDVQRLALRWIFEGESGETDDLVLSARRLTSVDNLIDACGFFGQTGAGAPTGLKAAYERIAEVQVETFVQRARAGLAEGSESLDAATAAIDGFIAQGAMTAGARDLLRRLRARWAYSAQTSANGNPGPSVDLDRVIQRIQALRAKTVESGCTEEEAMAAAAKVAELLDRYELSLDAATVRTTACEGVSIATGRKRRAAVDACVLPTAAFCDCRVWSEEAEAGELRYMVFGLKADVAAARFLLDLIEATFATESARFRLGDIYQGLRGGDRRMALNSFQIGLAGGIKARLAALKAARASAHAGSSGFDLVAVKQSVVDEEIARLGLSLTSRPASSRRYVHGEAYAAGELAGSLFEPNAAIFSKAP